MIFQLVKKEAREILRDPVVLAVAIILPVIMLFLFGYAISLDVDDVSMAVYDQDRSQESARLIESFTGSGYFILEHYLDSPDQADRLLDKGEASLVLVIPPEFSKDIHRGKRTEVQVILDGSFSATALIISNYAVSVVNRYSEDVLEKSGMAVPGQIGISPRVWYNPPLKSVNYIVPGLFAVLLMAFPPMLTALSIVREKERGTIEQIYVSPVSPPVFIMGKVIPYGVIAFLEMILILVIGVLWFRIPFKGSMTLLVAISLIYVLTTVSIGLFVSTITRTQFEAMFLSLIVTLMPSFLFSGFLFPIATMPYILQIYTYVFPARYFNDISRDIFLKGVGLDYFMGNAALLVIYGSVLFMAASLKFKKKVA